MVDQVFVEGLLRFQGGGHEVSQQVGIFDHGGDLNGSLPVVIVGTLAESQLNDVLLLQVGGIVQDSVLGGSARALGHLLGHQVEVPVFLGDSVVANDGTGLRVEESLMVLGEEAFRDTFLHDYFHKLGVVVESILGDVLEAVQDLLHFVFKHGLELAFRHTVSVEDNGVGVAAVDAVVISQGAFHQGTNLVHDFDLLALGLLDQGHVLGDALIHGGHETDGGHLASLVMNVGTDDHGVFREGLRLGGMPDGEADLDVHLENDSADGGKTFLERVGEDTLGSDTELVQAKLLDVGVDPASLVVEKGDDNLAVTGNTAVESVSEVVGTVALDFHTDGLGKSDAEGLGALLEHAHEFLGVFEVVVHKHPVAEMSSVLDLFINTS